MQSLTPAELADVVQGEEAPPEEMPFIRACTVQAPAGPAPFRVLESSELGRN